MGAAPTGIIPPIPVLGIQITLTTANTIYNLLTLLQAVDKSTPGDVTAFEIQVDPASAANVFIGDANMSTTATKRYGFEIQGAASAGSGFWFGPSGDSSKMPLGSFYLASTSSSVVINVLIINA